jgi:hypothetical protein
MSSAAQAVLATPAPVAAAPTAAELARAAIAKSIPAPQEMSMFYVSRTASDRPSSFFYSILGSYNIGDTLSDASITALGLDATNKPVKKIDEAWGAVAIIYPRQIRTILPIETSTFERGTVFSTTRGLWGDPYTVADTDVRAVILRLNLATLLA